MTPATPKPRAGEPMKTGALHKLIAEYRHLAWPEEDQTVEAMRLDLIERALREHSSKMKALEAERDLLREELEKARAQALADRAFQNENAKIRERERELVEALKAASEALRSSRHIMSDSYNRELAVELANKCDAALTKHGR